MQIMLSVATSQYKGKVEIVSLINGTEGLIALFRKLNSITDMRKKRRNWTQENLYGRLLGVSSIQEKLRVSSLAALVQVSSHVRSAPLSTSNRPRSK